MASSPELGEGRSPVSGFQCKVVQNKEGSWESLLVDSRARGDDVKGWW
jgi:hypothetical protein